MAYDNTNERRPARNRASATTHGKSSDTNRLYRIWCGMRTRCRNPAASGYANYGGRGIKVCSEWSDFAVFEAWALANGYTDELTIERRDTDGPYASDNCAWATKAEQARNTRRSIIVEVNGKVACLKDHATDAGVSYWALVKHVKFGRSAEDAIALLQASARAGRQRTWKKSRKGTQP